MTPILRTLDVTHSESVGHCIYCGEVNDLTDEHVIPLSLGGNYVLDKSSRKRCAAITGKFEGGIARGFMYEARVAGSFPTRRPKERPTHLPLLHGAGTAEKNTTDVPASEHPGFMHLPLLRRAGVLDAREYSAGLTIEGFETLLFGEHPQKTLSRLGSTEIEVTARYRGSEFARLLAKIAYSSAVAALGPLDRARVPVLPLILGNADDASYWLGSADFTLNVDHEKPLHSLAFARVTDPRDSSRQLLVARVKLFAGSGATGYEVVVFERHGAASANSNG